jgi:hypothetical protein
MATISEFLDTLLKEGTDFARDELKDLLNEAKSDNRLVIKHMGEMTEEFIKLRALGQLTNDELKELMEDVTDLNKMQYRKLSVQAKVRADKISKGFKSLVTDSLLGLI